MRTVAVAALVLVLAGIARAAAVDETRFRYERTLPAGGAAQPVAFEPDGLMLFHAREGFPDLRILDVSGAQVPWRRVPELEQSARQVDVLDAGRSGDEAVALLDLGPGPAPYDRVDLDIPDTRFVGRATVLGGDRRLGPFRRLSSTGIYDIEGATNARSTTAVLSRSDFRFLEVRASNVSAISGATVSGSGERPRLIRRRHALLAGSGAGKTETQFTLDLGTPRIPVTELEVSATTPVYERPLRIEGSNHLRNFELLTRARMFRFRGSMSAPVGFESRFRYLRVTIENGDDPPLVDVRLETRGPSRAVLLEPGHEPPFRLLYGGPEVDPPSYEFARIPPPAPRVMLDPSRLGPESRNASFEPPGDTRSFTDRHPALIELALVATAGVLLVGGFLALRKRT